MEALRCSVSEMAVKNSVILELLARVRTRLDPTRRGNIKRSHKDGSFKVLGGTEDRQGGKVTCEKRPNSYSNTE